MERHQIFAYHTDTEESQRLPYRSSLWIDDGGAVGDVSATEDFYTVIQYGDILEAVGHALTDYSDTMTPKGYVRLSDSGHRMSAYVDFEGLAAEPESGDVIDLGLQIRAGHTGFHGLQYDVGARRQVCTNGMLAFVSDLHFEQTHQDPLDYGLVRQAVDAIVDGVDVVEDRLARATDREFINADEALLVLLDHGLDAYFDNPVPVLRDSLREELATGQAQPTLYDTYNAATRGLTHAASLSTARREEGLERAARLLDAQGDVPEATDLGRQALDRRVEAYTSGEEVDPYWDAEEETLHALLAAHDAGGTAG